MRGTSLARRAHARALSWGDPHGPLVLGVAVVSFGHRLVRRGAGVLLARQTA